LAPHIHTMKKYNEKTIAIHQPNFLPWLGYFHKMNNCDIFVFHDDVELNWNGHTRRIQVRSSPTSNEMDWINIPIPNADKYAYINEIEIPSDPKAFDGIMDKIKGCYSGTPHYKQVFPVIKRCIIQKETNLGVYNQKAITILAKLLDIKPTLVVSSKLETEGRGQEKVINIVKAIGANNYLSGMGAISYQLADVFEKNKIDLTYLESAKDLNLVGKKVPHLLLNASIVDCLFYMGVDWVKETLDSLKPKIEI